ncbi:MAG: nitrate reductase molybdenum cofactor assembly chaperone [Phycisphaerales bacterium]|jgi:nitrate reductase delta subunit|nr:nitrate reductase molybdenum cofactor assembly chaperone [Phycisphaerales bacterium]
MRALRIEIYAALAELLAYPGEDFHTQVKATAALLRTTQPDAAAHLDRFSQQIADQSPQQLEESYTRTFDINPVCCLEVGWHLHGDNYDRGDFMVQMRKNLRELGLEEGLELPDHLTHVLPVVGRLREDEGDELAKNSVAPAIGKMLEGLAGKENPYEQVLLSVMRLLPQAQAASTGSAT